MLLYYIQVAWYCFLITVLGVNHSTCCLGDSCWESCLIAECILKSVLIKDHSRAQHTLCVQPLSRFLAFCMMSCYGDAAIIQSWKYTSAKMWRFTKTEHKTNRKTTTTKKKLSTLHCFLFAELSRHLWIYVWLPMNSHIDVNKILWYHQRALPLVSFHFFLVQF